MALFFVGYKGLVETANFLPLFICPLLQATEGFRRGNLPEFKIQATFS